MDDGCLMDVGCWKDGCWMDSGWMLDCLLLTFQFQFKHLGQRFTFLKQKEFSNIRGGKLEGVCQGVSQRG